jgi:pyruvate/2-oxoacid:ferredoxin oxidoreductase beta subunit
MGYFCMKLKNPAQTKHSPNGPKIGQSGHPVVELMMAAAAHFSAQAALTVDRLLSFTNANERST